MRSAYLVLGVPGDADTDEIETAWVKAQQHYSRERLASDEGALRRFQDVKEAYQLLRDPLSRASHDRKLAAPTQAARTRTVVVQVDPESSPFRKAMVAGVWVLALVFAGGFYVTWRNAEDRKAQAAQEEAARVAAEAEDKRRQEEKDRIAAERASTQVRAEAAERQLVIESRQAVARATADMRNQEAAAASARRTAQADQQREESNRLRDEQRAVLESQRRVERDKQRVRELCMQLYRRPDC